MRKCDLRNLDVLFAKIAGYASLYLPVDGDDGRAHFAPWREGLQYSGAVNTVRSAKDFFFPRTEDLMSFKVSGKSVEIRDTRTEAEDFVLFGVRACDVRSFEILDRVFLSDPVDTYYENRRRHGIIVSMVCDRPAETCFCGTFGIDAAEPSGDVICHKTKDVLYLEAKTDKGRALLDVIADVTEACGSEAVAEQKAVIRERLEKLPLAGLSADRFGGGRTAAFFDDPRWQTLSESCLGCGTCTFVCPTCQCYDIKDLRTADGVIRFRCWDSCMYSSFTKMSAGQPRLTQMERFRQRFMHKLVYYPENNEGIFGCVGCGRCLSRCPVSMNIVKVMESLGGDGK